MLADQRKFFISGERARSFWALLDRPAEDNAGLRDLFSRPDPWATE
jgi:uncharacterized protein (DUF1778 family)